MITVDENGIITNVDKTVVSEMAQRVEESIMNTKFVFNMIDTIKYSSKYTFAIHCEDYKLVSLYLANSLYNFEKRKIDPIAKNKIEFDKFVDDILFHRVEINYDPESNPMFLSNSTELHQGIVIGYTNAGRYIILNSDTSTSRIHPKFVSRITCK